MEIREERHDDVTVLTLLGELDARTLPTANEKLNSLFDSLRVRLVVNLGASEMVTSTGIGFLVDAAKRTRKFGGDTVLSNPPRLLQRSLESLKIGDYFRTFPGDREAVAWFRDRELDETQAPAPPQPPERRGWFGRFFRRGGS
jgi:anti-anti-sigma factor